MNKLEERFPKFSGYNKLSGYKKYRSLILSLSLFSLLVVSIMVLSLYISNLLEKDTKIINTAFEQTSLLNEVVSDLYIINSQYNTGQASNLTQERLASVVNLIDRRLTAFKQGGELPVVSIGAFNELDIVDIDPPSDQLKPQIDSIWSSWVEYKRRVLPALEFKNKKLAKTAMFDRYQFYGSVLHKQGAISGLSRIGLNNKVDNFALQLQKEKDKHSNFLDLVQIIGIAITGFSLALILFFVVRQLRQSDTNLENAREEARGILSTVQEGLFLVHKDLTIGSEYSNELEKILGVSNIASKKLHDILNKMVSEKDIKNIDSFITSLFNPKVVAGLIMSLNPLKELHVNIDNNDGTIEEKYLSFKFYRVTKKGVISDILVSVKDITDKVLLQNKLEITESNNEEQAQMIISLMNINSSSLKNFIENSTKSLKKINEIFKQPVSNKKDFQEKIDHSFLYMHTIKGESSAIELSTIAKKAHTFENDLEALKNIDNIGGMNFLPLTIQLEQLISYLEKLTDIAEKIHGFNNRENVTNNRTEWEHLKTLANDTAAEYNKKVHLVASGLSEINADKTLKQSLNSILVHLIKNSLVHGIESPNERIKKSKPEVGRIDLTAAELADGSLEVIIRDDGRGIDSAKIAEKLVDQGLATQEQVNNWSSIEINKHIFSNGFSTANVDMHAGRGVGLSAVYEMIRNMGGNLKVKQHLNQYCQFSITLPTSN